MNMETPTGREHTINKDMTYYYKQKSIINKQENIKLGR